MFIKPRTRVSYIFRKAPNIELNVREQLECILWNAPDDCKNEIAEN